MKEKQLSILLAEDDLNLGYLLTEFLESQGLTVKLFRDGGLQNRKLQLLHP
jgi:DNA-binding response OmpR family regulator